MNLSTFTAVLLLLALSKQYYHFAFAKDEVKELNISSGSSCSHPLLKVLPFFIENIFSLQWNY